MTKVQISKATATFLLGCTVALGLGLAVAACEQQEPSSEPDRVARKFGDSYRILTNEHPDAPDDPPSIDSDTLFVQVSYAGGCEDHDFDLDFDTAVDTTRLWLRHNDGGDDCEAIIYDRLAFPLPEDALDNATILLLNPHHDDPFIVRWRAP